MSKRDKKAKVEQDFEVENCPLVKLMREHACLIRARRLANNIVSDTKAEQLSENPIIGDWSVGFLDSLIIKRMESIEEYTRIEQPTSDLGMCYQLMIARVVMPVSCISDEVWKGHPGESRDARQRENHIECILEAAIILLLERLEDADLDLIAEKYGPPSPVTPAQAIQNLMSEVRASSPIKPLEVAA